MADRLRLLFQGRSPLGFVAQDLLGAVLDLFVLH